MTLDIASRDIASRPRSLSSLEQWCRGWAGVLDLWRVCDRRACRIARCCRGDAANCFSPNFQRLPRGLRVWFINLMAAKEANLPFDYALGFLDGAGYGDAFRDWSEQGEALPPSSSLPGLTRQSMGHFTE